MRRAGGDEISRVAATPGAGAAADAPPLATIGGDPAPCWCSATGAWRAPRWRSSRARACGWNERSTPRITDLDRDPGQGRDNGEARRGAGGALVRGSKPPPFHGGVVQAEVLDTVIAQQRMVAAAHVAPKVPFMPLLVGAKGPTHVKFASDSDTEEGDAPRRREDDEKEETPHAEPHETSSRVRGPDPPVRIRP